MNGLVMISGSDRKLEQILHLKVDSSDFGPIWDRGSLPYPCALLCDDLVLDLPFLSPSRRKDLVVSESGGLLGCEILFHDACAVPEFGMRDKVRHSAPPMV